jgi:DNA-directed RNA polymerase specialized sigma24 family protein
MSDGKKVKERIEEIKKIQEELKRHLGVAKVSRYTGDELLALARPRLSDLRDSPQDIVQDTVLKLYKERNYSKPIQKWLKND